MTLPFIETERLVIRPFEEPDVAPFAALAGVPSRARMMGSVPLPFTEDEARDWLDKRSWDNPPGYFLAITDRAGVLLGGMGPGPAPAFDFGYVLSRAAEGRGIATEAGRAVIAAIFAAPDAPQSLTAGCFTDNPASARVLTKLGFRLESTEEGRSRARLEPCPVWKYRLTRESFGGGCEIS